MQHTHHGESKPLKDLLNTLATTRDEVRLRGHLFSLEARERWLNLESRIDMLQTKLEHEGERLSEAALDSIHDLTHAASVFFHDGVRSTALLTPADQFMSTPVTCFEHDNLDQPAQLMQEFDCGLIPVVDAYWALVGLISDRDVCMAAHTGGQSLASMRVDSVMSRTVHSVTSDTSLQAICTLMSTQRIRRVPVLQDGQLVGIVAVSDIARWLEAHGHAEGPGGSELVRTLAAISTPRGVGPEAPAE